MADNKPVLYDYDPNATMFIKAPAGMVAPGNLTIWNRPMVQNADGTHSSEYSVSFEDDDDPRHPEVLVPTVVNGRFLTPDGKKPPEGSAAEKAMFHAAFQHYKKTGENLGKFDNPDDADAYAEKLHNRPLPYPKGRSLLADNSNVVNPQANSPVPQATLGPVTQSLLAGMKQPLPPAPTPPAPTPVQQNTSKWEGLVKGALLGLMGGLKAGIQNSNTAGTRDFRPANGLAMGEQEVEADRQREQLAQQEQQAQKQQDFQNQLAAGRYSQNELLTRAQTAAANLTALKLGMAIDAAPKAQQDAYYKQQDALADHLHTEGMSELASVPDLASLSQWMQQSGKKITDITTTHHRGPDGKDEILVWENPDHPVDADTINAQGKPYGFSVPAGTSMQYGAFRHALAAAQDRHATALNAQALQAQKDKASMQRTQATNATELEKAKIEAASKNADPAEIQSLAHGAVQSGLTIDTVPGFAKVKPQFEAYLATKYPNLDQESIYLTGEQRKRRDLAKNALNNLSSISDIVQRRPDIFGVLKGRASQGELLAGTNDKDLAALQAFAENTALALTGAHSIRSTEAREKATSVLLNLMHNGPQGVQGAIGADVKSLKDFSTLGLPHDMQGRLLHYNPTNDSLTPKSVDLDAKTGQVVPSNAWIKHNSKTGRRIYSADGGKTWALIRTQ